MNDLQQRVSYLKGLADGLGVKCDDTKEGKIISGILDLLDDITDSIAVLDASCSELDDYVECIDEDLVLLEDIVYTSDIDEYGDFIELICPNCQQIIYIDDEDLEDEEELVCPSCEYEIYLDEYEDLPIESD